MNNFYSLVGEGLCARVSALGGAIVDASFEDIAILRPWGDDGPFSVGQAGSFPLVPFGNRVAGNVFSFDGRNYQLVPNTNWDRHHLHGDGWQSLWSVVVQKSSAIELALEHRGPIYTYAAKQQIEIANGLLTLTLSVTNLAERTMPFGLGHHPFFPLTPKTTLTAPAQMYWTEKVDFLPDALDKIPTDLDFSGPRHLPRHWVNNGFEGWTGSAEIVWPEHGLAAELTAGPEFSRYFIFVSGTHFDASFRNDYFCFEPMTHSADAHHLADLGGLRRLQPGESLSTQFSIKPRKL
ncbi:MAG: aldose 1-epimerase [Pseudomonadota bacterium]|nr:aldose 1-epimerase [Pseudomonadota bacterium]